MENGRNDFIRELYEKEHDRLFRIALRLTANNPQDAADLLHNTFLFALFSYEKIASYKFPGAWLIQTMYNLNYNERRLLRSQREISLDSLDLSLTLGLEDPVSSLDEILPNDLSDTDKKILRLRFECQMSHREIANSVGVSEAACRMRLSRALDRCREYLLDKCLNSKDEIVQCDEK